MWSVKWLRGCKSVLQMASNTYLKTGNLLSKPLLLIGECWLVELRSGLHHAVLGSQDWKHFLEIKILTRERQPQTPRQPRTNTTGNHKRAQTHSTGRRKREQNSKSALNLQQTSTKPSHNAHAAFTLTDRWEKQRQEIFGCVCVWRTSCHLNTKYNTHIHAHTHSCCCMQCVIEYCAHSDPYWIPLYL